MTPDILQARCERLGNRMKQSDPILFRQRGRAMLKLFVADAVGLASRSATNLRAWGGASFPAGPYPPPPDAFKEA